MTAHETFEELQKQSGQANQQHLQILKKLFDAVEADPSQFTFELVQ